MRKIGFIACGALASSSACLVACGDDTVLMPPDGGVDASLAGDSAAYETGAFDGLAADSGAGDATTDGGGDALGPPPARLLLSFDGTKGQSELAAFGLQSGTVDGRLLYAAKYGAATSTASGAWLLEQDVDLVARLDSLAPWLVRSSWSVALHDATDAGYHQPYSDPDGVVVTAGTEAYVLRYNRNAIAVVDASQDVEAGAPTAIIDLSPLVQPGGDGYVEMTAGYYDPKSQRVYVVLGNIDRFDIKPPTYDLGCSRTTPMVVAIDTTTHALVPLGAGGDGGVSGWPLQGFDPAALTASPMVYDPPNNRLLVLEDGCYSKGDGGSTLSRRGVEAVSLADGSTKILLDLSAQSALGFPQSIFYVDTHHVIVQLDKAYMWDPSSPKLGAAIANAPQAFAVDGNGNLVGVSELKAADGGKVWTVQSVNAADGGVTTLGQNPFSLTSGFLSGVALWPPQ